MSSATQPGGSTWVAVHKIIGIGVKKVVLLMSGTRDCNVSAFGGPIAPLELSSPRTSSAGVVDLRFGPLGLPASNNLVLA